MHSKYLSHSVVGLFTWLMISFSVQNYFSIMTYFFCFSYYLHVYSLIHKEVSCVHSFKHIPFCLLDYFKGKWKSSWIPPLHEDLFTSNSCWKYTLICHFTEYIPKKILQRKWTRMRQVLQSLPKQIGKINGRKDILYGPNVAPLWHRVTGDNVLKQFGFEL